MSVHRNPDKVSLATLFQVKAASMADFSIEVLRLSPRPSNALRRAEIRRLDQLLSVSREELLKLHNLGCGSVQQIEKKLDRFLQEQCLAAIIAASDVPEEDDVPAQSRSLRADWQVFAGRRECDLEMSVCVLDLSWETHHKLWVAQATSIGALLDWTWNDLIACGGVDEANRVLDALVVVAVESRWDRKRLPVEQWPNAQEMTYLLQERWHDVPVSELGLAKATTSLLANGGTSGLFGAVMTLGELLIALKDPTSNLFLDLAAFSDACSVLANLGLHEGDALEHRQNHRQPGDLSLACVLKAGQEKCSAPEWDVISQRFGLGVGKTFRTLQEISDNRRVSRERVRQLEGFALKKLRKEPTVWSLARSLNFLLCRAGGVLSLQAAGEELETHFEATEISSSNIARLLFALDDEVRQVARKNVGVLSDSLQPQLGAIFALRQHAEMFSLVIATARALWIGRESVIESESWLETVVNRVRETEPETDAALVSACLRADGRFDPERFETIGVNRNLEEALVETLQRHGAPAHFTLLTQKMNEFGVWKREAIESSVHGRLGAHPELFVCVARGTYGLVSWGLAEQRITRDTGVPIAELIEEFLEAQGKPRPVLEIIDYVLARKRSHDYSVRQRLCGDPKFYRFATGIYGLKKWSF